MTEPQKKLFESIRTAAAAAERALEDCDAADCVDWLTTVQIKTAALAATLMMRIQNTPDYPDHPGLGPF